MMKVLQEYKAIWKLEGSKVDFKKKKCIKAHMGRMEVKTQKEASEDSR